MLDSVLDELARSISERRAILFAGAGLSMSVGLPSWQQLIDRLGEELGLDAGEAIQAGNSYQTLAEYYRLKQGSIGPLRSWMDRTWKVSEEAVRHSEVHRLIVALDFPIIYTTNYDRNIEVAYELYGRDFVKVANARDVAKISEGKTQIIKFHGDFDDDQSLVLAETDYFNRLSFDSPLDIKFRADAMGRTVLFVGYSMTDLNIRLLLHRLWQTWGASGYEKDRPRSFVFGARRDAVQETVLAQWGITTISGEGADPGIALAQFLARLAEAVARVGGGGEPGAAGGPRARPARGGKSGRKRT